MKLRILIAGVGLLAAGAATAYYAPCLFCGSAKPPAAGPAATSEAFDVQGQMQAAATVPAPRGKYDLAMSGCRFSCAAKSVDQGTVVAAQPGPGEGETTRCPVSGVLFVVDGDRPHVAVESHDFVTCCATCAEKLARTPKRYLSL